MKKSGWVRNAPICTKDVLTRDQRPTLEMEEHLNNRIMSTVLCANWVCAGTLMTAGGCQKAEMPSMWEK